MTELKKRGRPRVAGKAQTELDKIEKQFDEYDKQVKDLTLDRMNEAKKEEVEPQTQLSTKQISNSKDIYLKPLRSISSGEKFNEAFRDKYNFATELVHFIAENNEILGEKIEIWTKPFPGMPAEFWEVPVNIPAWGPRHLAEQIRSRRYHRLITENKSTGGSAEGEYYGTLVVDRVVQRLEAYPVSTKKSIFMGVNG